MSKISKYRAFVNEYFRLNMNGTQAYKNIYGEQDDNAAAAHASRLVRNGKVAKLIEERLLENQMSANEVLSRLAEQAMNEQSKYFQDEGTVDLINLIADGKAHLIKGFKHTRTGINVEFYDAQAALTLLGKYHGLFTDRVEMVGETIVKVIKGVSIDEL